MALDGVEHDAPEPVAQAVEALQRRGREKDLALGVGAHEHRLGQVGVVGAQLDHVEGRLQLVQRRGGARPARGGQDLANDDHVVLKEVLEVSEVLAEQVKRFDYVTALDATLALLFILSFMSAHDELALRTRRRTQVSILTALPRTLGLCILG